ncbi:DDE-type integrase/transposase/recombinase [Blastomonas sp. CCH5-A3]|uniref:DDE-type integrase/transposase/recombinase n=1 Tax=Blastomonas sp. CCH5-A3 TaxID=1768761 RepID=UPI000826345B|nr:DDE-type integrase/transposase/recombinase [Blastomonas sp. CCH5-A3]
MKVQTHLTAQQIADLKLDGLPRSAYRIRERALAEGWEYLERPATLGGRHFSIAALPEAARADLLAREAAKRSDTPRAANENRRGRGRPSWWDEHPEVAEAVEAYLCQRKLSSTVILDALRADFSDLPTGRTLRRFIKEFEERRTALIASFRNPDQFKGKHRVSIGNMSATVTAAHQIWEIDTTPADVMTTDGRKAVLGLIDRFSRRVRFVVCDSESAQSVRNLLIGTIRAWGVMPEAIITDQGSGFINRSIVSALEILGIEHRPCPPASPERKPFIERVFGTFTRQRAEIYPGFIGHNVAEAQALRARARKETGRAVIEAGMSAAELQAAIDAWTDGVYHLTVHSSLKMTPMAKWQSSPASAAAAPGEDVLRIALSADVGPRMVGKRGIQWRSGRYWCAALAAYVGQTVLVRRDEDDMGALFVFDEDSRFIDVAVNYERAGLSQQDFARQARQHQDQWMKVQRAEMRDRMRRYSIDRAAQDIMRADAEAAGKVTSLPMPTHRATTAAIDSIAMPPAPKPARPARPAIASDPSPLAELTTAEKVARADAILGAAGRGEPVDESALRAARAYAASTEYQVEKIMIAEFEPRPPRAVPTDTAGPDRVSGQAS